jgi:hypothetical protein
MMRGAGDRGVGLNVMSEYEYAWRRINVLGVPTGSTVTVASCLWARKIILSFLLRYCVVFCIPGRDYPVRARDFCVLIYETVDIPPSRQHMRQHRSAGTDRHQQRQDSPARPGPPSASPPMSS